MRTKKPSKRIKDDAIAEASRLLIIHKLPIHRCFMAVKSGSKKPGTAVMIMHPDLGLFPLKADNHLHQQLGAISAALIREWGYTMSYEERGELARYIGKMVSIGKPRLEVLRVIQESLCNQPSQS